MLSLTTVLVSVALATVIYLLFKKGKNKAKLPPGPFALPIIGNMLSMGKHPQKTIFKWAEEYGQMFTLAFGGSQMVVLNDPALIREALHDPNFAGRSEDNGFNIISDGPHGVISSSGQEWVDQRRFTLRHLRDFGFGKNIMEEMIMDELNEFVVTIKSQEGQPMSLARRLNLIVFNSLWRIMTGKRHSHDDKELSDFWDSVHKLRDESGLLLMITFFYPKMAKRFPWLFGWNKFVGLCEKMREFARRAVREHEANRPEDGQPRDFMDAYLKEIEGTTDENSSFYKQHGIKSLLAVVLDLFNAGSDTTATTLTWVFLILTKFPEVQKKIQEEIDSVVGKSRPVSLADRPTLPYVEATLLEVLRFTTIVPFHIPHTILNDVDFHGYHFPKGTKITSNHYYVHYNPKWWDEPLKFNPERFLSKDGKKVQKSENFMPFSLGKRQCIGETLARDELFLFTTNIFQRFNVRLSDESVNVSMDPTGLAMEAHEYSVIFSERQ